MQENEDFETNVFFSCMQNRFAKQLALTQEKRGIVCIPLSRSLRGIEFDKQFVEAHLFTPSPFLKDHFVTNLKGVTGVVLLEGGKIHTIEGFPDSRSVRIVGEELGYNKSSQPFKILLIDRPLIGTLATVVKEDDVFVFNLSHYTFDGCKTFLYKYTECFNAMKVINENVRKFVDNYLILADFLDDAAAKLSEICAEGVWLFMSQIRISLLSVHRFKEAVSIAIESYVMGCVHHKLFAAVCTRCTIEDRTLAEKCRQFAGTLPEQLGLQRHLSCHLTASAGRLSCIDQCVCPVDMMLCLKETMDCVADEVSMHLRTSSRKDGIYDDSVRLTSDDYIPLLVSVIIAQKSRHLASCLSYLNTFHFASMHADCHSFSLVTVQAAYSYFLALKPTQVRALVRTTTPETTTPSPTDTTVPDMTGTEASVPPPTVTRLDRDMARITRLLETSTRELADSNKQLPGLAKTKTSSCTSPPRPDISSVQTPPLGARPTGRQNKPALGEFLSSLKEDKLDCSYGKLT